MLEIRQQDDGQYRLSGVAMTYGDSASVYGQSERFEPGSIQLAAGAILNRMHDRQRPLARAPQTLELRDSAERLSLVATMPPTADAADVHQLVRAGVMRGLSVEFRAEQERFEANQRIIERALLVAVGVVDEPAYKLSRIEARGQSERLTETYAPRRRHFFF